MLHTEGTAGLWWDYHLPWREWFHPSPSRWGSWAPVLCHRALPYPHLLRWPPCHQPQGDMAKPRREMEELSLQHLSTDGAWEDFSFFKSATVVQFPSGTDSLALDWLSWLADYLWKKPFTLVNVKVSSNHPCHQSLWQKVREKLSSNGQHQTKQRLT